VGGGFAAAHRLLFLLSLPPNPRNCFHRPRRGTVGTQRPKAAGFNLTAKEERQSLYAPYYPINLQKFKNALLGLSLTVLVVTPRGSDKLIRPVLCRFHLPLPLTPSPSRADGSSAPTTPRGGGRKKGVLRGGGFAAAPQNPSLSPLSPARQGKGERGARGVRGHLPKITTHRSDYRPFCKWTNYSSDSRNHLLADISAPSSPWPPSPPQAGEKGEKRGFRAGGRRPPALKPL